MTKKGWYKESARHSLASRGLKLRPLLRKMQSPLKSSGKTKYCGYVIGEEITPEQVERLFHFLNANYTRADMVMMNDKQMHEVAEDNEDEWRY